MTTTKPLRMSTKPLRLTALFVAVVSIGTTACHYDRDTAGKPGMEDGAGKPGSVVATKDGTGDAAVGSGQGQVGTDAPPKPEAEKAK